MQWKSAERVESVGRAGADAGAAAGVSRQAGTAKAAEGARGDAGSEAVVEAVEVPAECGGGGETASAAQCWVVNGVGELELLPPSQLSHDLTSRLLGRVCLVTRDEPASGRRGCMSMRVDDAPPALSGPSQRAPFATCSLRSVPSAVPSCVLRSATAKQPQCPRAQAAPNHFACCCPRPSASLVVAPQPRATIRPGPHSPSAPASSQTGQDFFQTALSPGAMHLSAILGSEPLTDPDQGAYCTPRAALQPVHLNHALTLSRRRLCSLFARHPLFEPGLHRRPCRRPRAYCCRR